MTVHFVVALEYRAAGWAGDPAARRPIGSAAGSPRREFPADQAAGETPIPAAPGGATPPQVDDETSVAQLLGAIG